MKLAIVGGSGFLGRSLSDYLLENTNHQIISISHGPPKKADLIDDKRLIYAQADVNEPIQMGEALKGCRVVFYFVHLLQGSNSSLEDRESLAAENFADACLKNNVERVIYVSGLGDDHRELSKHLKSRHHTGEVLRKKLPQVIEFRASMIIGKGSISYDIVRNLTLKLPLMTLPRWSETLSQPIALRDVLKYLTASIEAAIRGHKIIEIGGSQVVSYRELYQEYASFSNKRLIIISLPIIPTWLSGLWLNLFTPRSQAKVGRSMVSSLAVKMVVTNDQAKRFFPQIKPVDLRTAFNEAEASTKQAKGIIS